MLLYLQRYFWAVALGFIASASGLAVGAANAVAGSMFEPAPLMPGDAPFHITRPVVATAIDAERFGHLFGIEPPPPPPPAAEPAPTTGLGPDGKPLKGGPTTRPGFDWNAEPVKSTMRVQLLATMVATDKRWSMALIADLDAQKSAYYLPGDMLRECTVYDVIRGGSEKQPDMRVIIINPTTNRLEYVDTTPGTGGAAPGVPNVGVTPVAAPTEVASNAEGIKQLEKGKYEISRAKLDSTLANLNDLATQARIVPNFKNGTSNGFKLFSIQPGSLYSAIGIQNGDVITQINGLDINSPEKALEIYTRLKDSSNIKVSFERNGQPQSSDYQIGG